MGICIHCENEKSLRTTKLCHACYQGLRKDKENYKKKRFRKDLVGTKCITCQKKREKIDEIWRNQCRRCYLIDYRKINPQYHEKHKKLCRDNKRRQKGIDVNLPLLNAPAGDGHIGRNGYKKICRMDLRGHPNADKKGGMYEHTLVMSEYLGRPLRKKELVHHKNGVRHDNRIENLELCHIGQPSGQRVEDKIKWCKEFLAQYGIFKYDDV